MPAKIKCATPECTRTVRAAETKTGYCRQCLEKQRARVVTPSLPEPTIESDQQKREQKSQLTELKKLYDQALDIIEQQKIELGAYVRLNDNFENAQHLTIAPREGSGTSEATPIICASDWHCEEIVTPAQVNGLNEFNEDIADRRITRFFQASQKLMVQHLNPGVTIHDVVVFLGGDFITNDIHEELVENVWCRPTEAILWVQTRLAAGIDFYLNHTKYSYTFVCRVGNHSRTTKKTYFSQENGHSLEHILYMWLASHYRNEPRVRFVIQDGYHIYLDVYSQTLRFHHGHAIKYAGGVGGITIPVNKAIAQWDKGRQADLDIFGHYHQTVVNRKFIANGSLIGYNSFGLSIKGEYEPPLQSLALIDKKRGTTCHWPIILE